MDKISVESSLESNSSSFINPFKKWLIFTLILISIVYTLVIIIIFLLDTNIITNDNHGNISANYIDHYYSQITQEMPQMIDKNSTFNSDNYQNTYSEINATESNEDIENDLSNFEVIDINDEKTIKKMVVILFGIFSISIQMVGIVALLKLWYHTILIFSVLDLVISMTSIAINIYYGLAHFNWLSLPIYLLITCLTLSIAKDIKEQTEAPFKVHYGIIDQAEPQVVFAPYSGSTNKQKVSHNILHQHKRANTFPRRTKSIKIRKH